MHAHVFSEDRNDGEVLHNMTERSSETKTIVIWTKISWRIPPELTSWRHCSNDIKGSCVFTSDRSKYEV